jgi:hypothetical protein
MNKKYHFYEYLTKAVEQKNNLLFIFTEMQRIYFTLLILHFQYLKVPRLQYYVFNIRHTVVIRLKKIILYPTELNKIV